MNFRQFLTFVFALIILVYFAVEGVSLNAIILHELKHTHDFRSNYEINNDEIHIYLLPSNSGMIDNRTYGGVYLHNQNGTIPEDFRQASEFSAYTINWILFILLAVSIALIMLFLFKMMMGNYETD